jgi:hypothetical protein
VTFCGKIHKHVAYFFYSRIECDHQALAGVSGNKKEFGSAAVARNVVQGFSQINFYKE